jgi:hypothetical integral membrane protein (TIGR02206 family)
MIAVLVTAVWAAATFTFSSIAVTDYGFVNGKPHTASLLEVLGRWPVYPLTAAALIFIVWALMTWPWERIRRCRRYTLADALVDERNTVT